ncbi:MAG: hypothetical protein GTO14_03520 [Anaerolineales bacterium]|nr:hypothetical protein [Anaerolineales bacterium]
MAKIDRTVTINAPVEKVFQFIEEPTNFPEVWPSMVAVKDVEPLPTGGRRFSWVYKMAGLSLEGASETTEYVENQRLVSETKGGIQSKFVWSFAPEGEGTKLHVDIEYTVPVPVLGKLAEGVIVKMNEREAGILLANIKDRLEA